MDFEEEEPFDLTEYDPHYEWDEAEYMKLRFIAARHYVFRGHWDDAYAYVLRSRPDNISQHEDTYNRNAQAWHYTNARINELIHEAEQALELRDEQLARRLAFKPPEDSLIPPGHSTGVPSPMRGDPETDRVSERSSDRDSPRRPEKREGRVAPRSPLSPDQKYQREERNSVNYWNTILFPIKFGFQILSTSVFSGLLKKKWYKIQIFLLEFSTNLCFQGS